MSQLRHVRRLRFRCAQDDHARHGRVLLEDAMRTASLDDGQRLIVVRRLDLGRVSARASATEWSQQLERSYRAARPVAVRFDEPGAEQADAVSFADRLEPWSQLAERTALGRLTRAWFWPLAAPGWSQDLSRGETLRLCFRALAAGGGFRATLALARCLERRHVLPDLVRCLENGDLTALRFELGSPAWPDAASLVRLPGRALSLSATELECVARWDLTDLRLRWLAAVRIAARYGSTAAAYVAPPISPEEIDAVVKEWKSSPVPRSTSGAAPSDSTPEARTTEAARAEVVDPDTQPADEPAEQAETSAYTGLGGLFFTLPLLVRGGFPEAIADLPREPRSLMPWRVLQLFSLHARGERDDPLWQAVEMNAEPLRWADQPDSASFALSARGSPTPPFPHLLGPWLLKTNRLALAGARMNLRQLITRPALVTITPTHLELAFRPGDADVRIRRAGLDLNPGWVPWLGRVIVFRFDREN